MSENIAQHALMHAALAARNRAHVLEARAAHRTLSEMDFYPPRPERHETPGFRAIRQDILVKRDMPCHICGVTQSVLSDPAKRADGKMNPYGATQMELHHCYIECQLALAISLDKFNAKIWPWLHRWKPDMYPMPFLPTEILAWVDHGEENMQALCDVHHRNKYLGVHAISGPIWGPQDLFGDNFEAFVHAKIMEEDAKNITPANPTHPGTDRV